MNLTVGFSPCPNDTFIFDALVHEKVDTEGLEFDAVLADVQELNQRALNAELDISKLSFAAYAGASKHYVLLNSGSALGSNCGPLLIARDEELTIDLQTTIAIPGQHTTANLLLSLAFPEVHNKKEVLFNEIEDKVLNNEVDAGLIIHENRFTYEQKGLSKIMDFGKWWEQETSMPIPLGGIAIRRTIQKEVQLKVNRVLRRSVEFALNNPKDSNEYIKEHAQEVDDMVIRQHIKLYVNEFSIDLGKEGKDAIKTLFNRGTEEKVMPIIKEEIIFVE